MTVPYRTFPLAGRKGTTILDRSTAYPRFGRRAGDVAAEAARAGDADVVYALGASAYGYALAKRRGEVTAPLVLNPQGLEEFGGADGSYGGRRIKGLLQPLRRVVRACAAEADAVIATDRALEPVVTRHLAVEPSRLRLVPNGIDVGACDALATQADGQRVRGAAGLDRNQMVLLSVGRLERNKGFHHLADALARWRERADWHWVIAGTGPFRRTIEEAIRRAGIERRVTWARPSRGWRPPRVVRGRRPVCPSDCLRREFPGHARGHDASAAGRGQPRGWLAGQSAARDHRVARAAWRSTRTCRRAERRAAAARDLARDGRRGSPSG